VTVPWELAVLELVAVRTLDELPRSDRSESFLEELDIGEPQDADAA
jgi:hypothetical protein